jgi:hypothetical protein
MASAGHYPSLIAVGPTGVYFCFSLGFGSSTDSYIFSLLAIGRWKLGSDTHFVHIELLVFLTMPIHI